MRNLIVQAVCVLGTAPSVAMDYRLGWFFLGTCLMGLLHATVLALAEPEKEDAPNT